jgi:hypothetical protein
VPVISPQLNKSDRYNKRVLCYCFVLLFLRFPCDYFVLLHSFMVTNMPLLMRFAGVFAEKWAYLLCVPSQSITKQQPNFARSSDFF